MQMEFSLEFEQKIDRATQQLMQLLSVPHNTAEDVSAQPDLSHPEFFKSFKAHLLKHPLVVLETVSIPLSNSWLHEELLGKAFPDIRVAQESWMQSSVVMESLASAEAQSGMHRSTTANRFNSPHSFPG